MTAPIGFYVHHHGRGHVSRAAGIIAELDRPATVLTSATVTPADVAGAEVVHLPPDVGPTPHDAPLPPTLHHAPVGLASARDRTARIAGWLAEAAPALLVVDVSAEVSLLGRLASTPVVTVRQHGARWDAAHLQAYGASVALLAPFSSELEEPDVPAEVARSTRYVGGFSRFDARAGSTEPWRHPTDASRPVVAVLAGAGGDGIDLERVRAAARVADDHVWVVIGGEEARTDGLVHVTGWCADPLPYLLGADVVVSSAGHNSVMEVAAARRPLVCLPEPRPFDEQERKAARLAALDVAEVVRGGWPDASRWPALLERARDRGGAGLARLVDGAGARRAAAALTELAERWTA